MNDINEFSLDEQLKQGTTRRTVVTTGAKLAYAAPLVAATVALTASGALAACGGATPFALTGTGGDLLCCGCCSQTSGITRAQRRLAAQQATSEDFVACQTLLAGEGITCPLAGQPGDDITRVCIAPDANPIISPRP
jgi:hypothetical protein